MPVGAKTRHTTGTASDRGGVMNYFKSSRMRLSTTCADISRLAASGITSEWSLSITSSLTIILRRTGKQCIK